MKHSTLAIVASLAFAAACGSKQPATTTPPAGGGEAGSGTAAGSGAEAGGAPVNFDDLDHAGKLKLMKTKVLPEMGAMFTAFDPQKWPKVECKTCHGKGAEDGTFKMPNPDLPRLDFAHMDQLSPEKQKIAKFMSEQVKPKMAELVGQQPMGPDNPHGFGCLECHMQVGQ